MTYRASQVGITSKKQGFIPTSVASASDDLRQRFATGKNKISREFAGAHAHTRLNVDVLGIIDPPAV